ncbi:MAG: polysaccharide biosynthesis/export family protein [Pseudomonadota bacterium]
MRRLFSGGIAILISCLVGCPLYAGSGLSLFPEAAMDGQTRQMKQGETESGNYSYKDGYNEDKPAVDRSEPTPKGEKRSGSGQTRGAVENGKVKPEKSKGRRDDFFSSLLPWGSKKERVQTIPKREPAESEVAMEENTLTGAETASVNSGGDQPGKEDLFSTQYVLGVGDVIQISVWKDESLSKVLPILPDGMINFPLIGRIKAAGKTVQVLETEMDDQLARYVPDPFVDISVQQANSMLIYMIGRINQPGRYPLQGNMTILQALAMAGGLNPFAKKDSVQIIRERDNATQIFRFNYNEVVKGINLEQNIRLMRGDVIVAP